MGALTRRLIRADGTAKDLIGPLSMKEIGKLIGADTLDSVNLRHLGSPPRVMLVDDNGHAAGKPVNEEATRLYHANCYPGTTHQIVGDVVVVLDEDFA